MSSLAGGVNVDLKNYRGLKIFLFLSSSITASDTVFVCLL